jgi:hypothetical protein
MGAEPGQATNGLGVPPQPRVRLAAAVAIVACIAYGLLLVVGLVPPNRSFGWEHLTCPVLAGPGGTATPLQQLRFGPQACTSGEGPRLAMLVGLAALAGIAAAGALAAGRSRPQQAGNQRAARRVVVPAIVTVALVAALLPWSTLLVWHDHDDPVIGPEPVRATVTAVGGLCINFVNGTWVTTTPIDDKDNDVTTSGTITIRGTTGTFTEDGPNGRTFDVTGSWPADPRQSVVCAIG